MFRGTRRLFDKTKKTFSFFFTPRARIGLKIFFWRCNCRGVVFLPPLAVASAGTVNPTTCFVGRLASQGCLKVGRRLWATFRTNAFKRDWIDDVFVVVVTSCLEFRALTGGPHYVESVLLKQTIAGRENEKNTKGEAHLLLRFYGFSAKRSYFHFPHWVERYVRG